MTYEVSHDLQIRIWKSPCKDTLLQRFTIFQKTLDFQNSSPIPKIDRHDKVSRSEYSNLNFNFEFLKFFKVYKVLGLWTWLVTVTRVFRDPCDGHKIFHILIFQKY